MANHRTKGLPQKVAEEYRLGPMVEAGEVNSSKYGLIDLRSISLEKAKTLAEDESFIYLLPKKKDKPE